ncbi:MAG: glycogen/starch/alpha-glucan phosphorylase [Desulfobulbaceae bacterium]|jgi:starch phosphorylase|nr:glycogen/starch/alpha-glucan phosphorylase [Desulfobulbaceae bacterium]
MPVQHKVIAIPESCPDIRTGTSKETLRKAFLENLFYVQGRALLENATRNDLYMALAYTIRDRLLQGWLHSLSRYFNNDTKVVFFLSAEYLPGPHLANNLLNLDLQNQVRGAMADLDFDVEDLIEQEEEPGLGNGGLGRLAACFMDSLATMQRPAIGYGIRYEFGIFDQIIRNGWQEEITDKWLRFGNPWEIPRPDDTCQVGFGGHTEAYTDAAGNRRIRWIPGLVVNGVPFDTPIPGYRVNNVNVLRLWKAEATESFNFQAFNVGDYYGAVEAKVVAENISKVLYPNDQAFQGKQLRLTQQYFFVSCSLQDVIRTHLRRGKSVETIPRNWAGQLNDTHPSIAVAEMMRLLVDQYQVDWNAAWDLTRETFNYTNHTLLPEALEKWPVHLFEKELPRHLQIIYEINQRFLDKVRLRYPGNNKLLSRVSLIEETDPRYVRMANLAVVGSHAVNGVAAMHTQLVKNTHFADFFSMDPEKFHNITNGVTPRRWIMLSNPALSNLIDSAIGHSWSTNLELLSNLEPLADDEHFQKKWMKVKLENKKNLAAYIKDKTGLTVDPASLFDIQVKRIHEYKRQHLNVLHILTRYHRIKQDPDINMVPRTFIFGGKAAPGYSMAKLIIKLINSVAEIINSDEDVGDRLKVVFIPDFNVKVGQRIYPSADLSEQISTAGKEASGTGNMKFSLNGALTIGTLDGANVEIREAVGWENFFLFGLTVDKAQQLDNSGYIPYSFYENNLELRAVLDLLRDGYFSHGDAGLFKPLCDHLLYHDDYFVLADYDAYLQCQEKVDRAWLNPVRWAKMSIINTARTGYFSSDRAIEEYCNFIWKVKPSEIDTL